MTMKDLHNNVKPMVGISPQATTGATSAITSAIIDTQGFSSLEFIAQLGALFSGATFTPSVAGSDASDMGSPTALTVANGGILGDLDAMDTANTVKKIGVLSNYRYVQLTLTAAGGGSTSYVAADAVMGHPAVKPTT